MCCSFVSAATMPDSLGLVFISRGHCPSADPTISHLGQFISFPISLPTSLPASSLVISNPILLPAIKENWIIIALCFQLKTLQRHLIILKIKPKLLNMANKTPCDPAQMTTPGTSHAPPSPFHSPIILYLFIYMCILQSKTCLTALQLCAFKQCSGMLLLPSLPG